MPSPYGPGERNCDALDQKRLDVLEPRAGDRVVDEQRQRRPPLPRPEPDVESGVPKRLSAVLAATMAAAAASPTATPRALAVLSGMSGERGRVLRVEDRLLGRVDVEEAAAAAAAAASCESNGVASRLESR